MPLHHQSVPGRAIGVLGDHLSAQWRSAGRRAVPEPARVVGPVSRRASDALHRTRLAGRAADRRRVPERQWRRLPIGHRPDRIATSHRYTDIRRLRWRSSRRTRSTPPETSWRTPSRGRRTSSKTRATFSKATSPAEPARSSTIHWASPPTPSTEPKRSSPASTPTPATKRTNNPGARRRSSDGGGLVELVQPVGRLEVLLHPALDD